MPCHVTFKPLHKAQQNHEIYPHVPQSQSSQHLLCKSSAKFMRGEPAALLHVTCPRDRRPPARLALKMVGHQSESMANTPGAWTAQQYAQASWLALSGR